MTIGQNANHLGKVLAGLIPAIRVVGTAVAITAKPEVLCPSCLYQDRRSILVATTSDVLASGQPIAVAVNPR
jgi:hypothetical protein